jgi:uncharacterized OsmC-like protein
MATTKDDKPVNNGVNVDALFGAQEALKNAPEAAKFKWRSTVEWVNGTHSRSTIEGFSAWAPSRSTRSSPSTPTIPRCSAARTAATPVEIVLAGLASCLTAGVAAVAQARKIQLRSVSATLEAGMDVRGILGMDEDVRNGFDGIKVTYKIDADASPADIKAIVAQSQKRSAVYDIITNPTNVTVEVA